MIKLNNKITIKFKKKINLLFNLQCTRLRHFLLFVIKVKINIESDICSNLKLFIKYLVVIRTSDQETKN